MKKLFLTGLLATVTFFLFAQRTASPEAYINAKEAERIEKVLASDEMKGRKIYSPELDKAANFIAGEFKAAGLQPLGGAKGFRQEFDMLTVKQTGLTATVNGAAADAKNIIVVTGQPSFRIDQSTGFEVRQVKAGENLFQKAMNFASEDHNLLVMVDESFAKSFPRLTFLKRNLFKRPYNTVFMLGSDAPANFTIEATHEIKEQRLANVVGVLPGKSRKDEYVIFSGHYDHLGVGAPMNGDSIYNGANDDAAGTTAVIMLSKYFKAGKEIFRRTHRPR